MLAVDINDDPFAENPLAFSIYKVGYRKNARTVLGNYPVVDIEEFVKIVNSDEVISKPVFAYIHGGVALSTYSWWGRLPQGHARFDSGQSGFIFASKAAIRESFGVKRITSKLRAVVYEEMQVLLDDFAAWLNGECYVVTLLDDGEELDWINVYGAQNAYDEANRLVIAHGIADGGKLYSEMYDYE